LATGGHGTSQPPKELMRPSRKPEEPFSYGTLGAFQGKLNPIFGKTIYETCAVPILLYGCENWILTDGPPGSLPGRLWKKNSEIQEVPLPPMHQNSTQVAINLSQNFNPNIEPPL